MATPTTTVLVHEHEDEPIVGDGPSSPTTGTITDISPEHSETQRLTSRRSTDETSTTIIRKSSKLPQVIAALSATIGAFGLGNVVSWSSPAIPSLKEGREFGIISQTEETWLGSIVTLGCAISTLLAGPMIDWLGRKNTLIALGIPFVAGWLLVAFSKTLTVMMIGRFITGFCGGAFTMIVPVYCSEIAQTEIRGALSSLMVLLLVAGILFVNIVGTFTTWFWLSIICTGVPVLFLACMVFMPESPVFLLMKGKPTQAKKSLQWLRHSTSGDEVSEELAQMQTSLTENYDRPLELLQPYIIKPFAICLGLMLFQQLSLINIVVFYTVDIFRSAGSTIDSNLCSIIIAMVQLTFAGLAIILVDRVGRKILLAVSSVGIAITLGVLGLFYHLIQKDHEVKANLGWLPLTSLILFIVFYNVGLGPLPWCLLSELMGSRVKSYTSGAAASFCWALAFLVTKYFKDLESVIGQDIAYWIFAGLSLLGLFFAVFIVPETKGKSLDEIQRLFR